MKYPVFIPEIVTTEGRVTRGHVFSAVFPGVRTFITCQHLFGRTGGLKQSIEPGRLTAEIRSFVLHDPDNDEVVCQGTRAYQLSLARPAATVSDIIDISADVAALALPPDYHGDFFIPDFQEVPAGSPLHIITTNQLNIDRRGTGSIAVTCVEHTAKYLKVKFPRTSTPESLSGAPVINAKGELVGMIAAGHEDRSGTLFGLAVPAMAIWEVLDSRA